MPSDDRAALAEAELVLAELWLQSCEIEQVALHILNAKSEIVKLRAETCQWTEDDEGTWSSTCGQMFVFMEGGPKMNRYKFCPYCGRPLTEEPWKEPDDDGS